MAPSASDKLAHAPRPTAAPATVTMVYLAVTGRCFLPCVHCHIGKHRTVDLPTDAWMGIIERLGAFCAGASVQFVGGEPLLRSDLEMLIERAASVGLSCGICTNGWMMTPARAESLAKAGVSFAYVSLDGVRAETVDRTRGKAGSFAKALRAVQLLKRQPTIRVVLSSILHAGNADEFPALIGFARKHGLVIVMQTLNATLGADEPNPRWRETSELWPRTPARRAAVERALDQLLAVTHEGIVGNTVAQLEAARRYYLEPEEPPGIPCPAGNTEFGIDPLGNVRLCFYKDEIGSALSPTPLSELFESPVVARCRAEIAECPDGCRLNTANQDRFAPAGFLSSQERNEVR